jgi:hypothetical protein
MGGVVPLTTNRAALHRLLIDMPAIRAEDEAYGHQLQRALERPYPGPVVDWPKANAA